MIDINDLEHYPCDLNGKRVRDTLNIRRNTAVKVIHGGKISTHLFIGRMYTPCVMYTPHGQLSAFAPREGAPMHMYDAGCEPV